MSAIPFWGRLGDGRGGRPCERDGRGGRPCERANPPEPAEITLDKKPLQWGRGSVGSGFDNWISYEFMES